ncbi:hypothetical protein DYI26_21585 [Halomonas litopenaei]|nr:hypothetical protein [Halomonas litopenaei]
MEGGVKQDSFEKVRTNNLLLGPRCLLVDITISGFVGVSLAAEICDLTKAPAFIPDPALLWRPVTKGIYFQGKWAARATANLLDIFLRVGQSMM